MTLADLPAPQLKAIPCHYQVELVARGPEVVLTLCATGIPSALARWSHEFTGDLARDVRSYFGGRMSWQELADRLDAYAGELTGLPADLRSLVGETFRWQRERYEASSRQPLRA